MKETPAGPGRKVEAGPGSLQGLWRSFSIRDGLAFPIVRAMLEDGEGRLWFGTQGGGVSCYDGRCFTTFTTRDGLAGDEVVALLEDREGKLWFGTRGWGRTGGEGVSCYDGRCFTTFTTRDGLAGNEVVALLEDREGKLWFGTLEGGVSCYDGRRFTTFTTRDGLPYHSVISLLEDREGNMWFGTWKGLSRYDGERFVNFSPRDGLGHHAVTAIVEDREGKLWFGTSGGLSSYDGRRFTTFTTQDGLAHDKVCCLLEDSEGKLWMGTEIGGLSSYDGRRFTTFTTQDGLANNQVTSIMEDRRGYLWFGTLGGGVSCYDRVHFATFTTREGLSHDGAMCIVEDRRGELWIGTWSGACRYDGGQFSPLEALAGENVWSIVEDGEGALWFGTAGHGVMCCEGERSVRFTAREGLAHDWVLSALRDSRGYLWFGTEGGVSRYDGRVFLSFDGENGLPNDTVYAILEDRQGNLWFGTSGGGVSHYDGERFVNFTVEDGLAHSVITSLLEDRQGNLWFGTLGGGVCRYDGRVFQTLSRKDGLAHDAVHQIAQDPRGDLWITTEGGLTRYRSSRMPPSVQVENVIADRRYGPVQEVHLPFSQKVLIFEFGSRSWTTPPERMAYVYRLEGYEADWQVSHAPQVEYENLPLGEYTFQLRAVDRDLNYSAPAAVAVKVEPDLRFEVWSEAPGGAAQHFVGRSPALLRVQAWLAEVAPTDLTVLIAGETGTGKGLAARILHGLSARKAAPFIQVNCGALPQGLVESELFGHERGAFTSAVARKPGKVELAAGGSLFLDEIGDLALEAQGKLLQLLEERSFERVGGIETLRAELRIIAATNRDLGEMVEKGQFREDLYFRLQAFPMRLPPLRERGGDIALLGRYFIEQMALHLHKEVPHLTPEAMALLEEYEWPGNVRELKQVVQRAVIVGREAAIRAGDIVLGLEPAPRGAGEKPLSLEALEERYIREVLEKTGWVVRGRRGAAAILGLKESTLRYRMKKLGIRR